MSTHPTRPTQRRGAREMRVVAAARARFDSIDHLGPEAVAAFVDGEMTPQAAHRARMHLALCAECRRDVARQQGTSAALRNSCLTSRLQASAELLARLNAIAQEGCPPGPGAGPQTKAEMLAQRWEDLIQSVRPHRPGR